MAVEKLILAVNHDIIYYTQLKLSREGQAEIVTRVWLHSDKVLAIQKQTNNQINIVVSLWQIHTAP